MNRSDTALEVDRVHVWRGEKHVLRGLSFGLPLGQLLHVVGANGTGKTTLLRVLCGLIAPETGEVRWAGADIRAARAQYQSQLAYAAHDAGLKADLTALENLRFAVGLKRRIDAAELLRCMRETGAEECRTLPARVLSAGQRRRVAMARVIAMQAPLWLLDEPFSNLDAAGVELFTGLIAAHVRDGGAAVVVAHHGLPNGADVRRLDLAA